MKCIICGNKIINEDEEIDGICDDCRFSNDYDIVKNKNNEVI